MAKLSLTDLASLANQASAISLINANWALIETAMENTLSRDGTSPNTMSANLDMNSHRILNLLAASGSTEPIRKAEYDADMADIEQIVTDAEAALASVQSIYDQFDDRYLGVKTSDPSVDNDGNSLNTGALYFNTTQGLKVYNGTTWVAISDPWTDAIQEITHSGSGTLNIDYSAGKTVRITQSANITGLTVSNWPATGYLARLTIELRRTGSPTISWPSGTIWSSGGGAPSLTSGGKDIIALLTTDGGTIIYGNVVGLNYA